MSKYKVLVLIPKLQGIGGMETVINEWINYYTDNEMKVSVTFLAPQGIANLERMVVSEHAKIKKTKSNSTYGKVVGLFKTVNSLVLGNYNEVICMSIPLIKIALTIKALFRRKYSVTSWFHFSLDTVINESDVPIVKRCDNHFAISTGISDSLKGFGVEENHIQLIYNPVDLNSFTPLKNVESSNAIHFGYVGRLIWKGQKNVSFLLKGLSNLKVDWSIEMFGVGDMNDLTLINSFVRDNALSQRVTIRGWSDHPFEEFSTVPDYVVLTSSYEGLPMALIESIGRGIPIISSDCKDGTKDIVSPDNGYIYHVNDMEHFVGVLNRAYREKQKFDSEKIRETSRKFSKEEYFTRLDDYFVSKFS
jgi:UDP-D-galactose:(glucosyl)LPS alpha-1,6-D-galactosyltransferase